jgi:hypothetical protein
MVTECTVVVYQPPQCQSTVIATTVVRSQSSKYKVQGQRVDKSPTYPSFLMLHAYFYTICLVFRYTSWHFYAFSGTNLLTRCHSASSLFSAVFVFQKCYTGNILGIGQNQSQSSKYFTELPDHRRGDRAEPEGGHTIGRRGLGLARAPWWCGPPGPPLTLPLRL